VLANVTNERMSLRRSDSLVSLSKCVPPSPCRPRRRQQKEGLPQIRLPASTRTHQPGPIPLGGATPSKWACWRQRRRRPAIHAREREMGILQGWWLPSRCWHRYSTPNNQRKSNPSPDALSLHPAWSRYIERPKPGTSSSTSSFRAGPTRRRSPVCARPSTRAGCDGGTGPEAQDR